MSWNFPAAEVADSINPQWYHFAFLLVALLLAVSAVSPASALAAQQSDADAEDALEARERALDKLDRLEELDETPAVDIDQSVTRSVRDEINQGNISYRDGEYAEAAEHYRQATEQSKAALVRAYITRSSLLLNASATHLQKLEERGYDRADISTYQRQRQSLEERRQAASSFADAREVHAEAEALHDEVETLPEPRFVRFVGGFYTVVIPLQVTLTLFAGLIGAAIMRWRSDPPDEDGDTGSGGGETYTPTTMD